MVGHVIRYPVHIFTCLCLYLYGASLGAQDNSAANQAPLLPAEIFAQLESTQQVELSPEADYIAYISPYEGRKHIYVHPVGPFEPLEDMIVIPPIDDADIKWFRWANNDRLLISWRYTEKEQIQYLPSYRVA